MGTWVRCTLRRLNHVWHKAANFFSAEFVLACMPNGGAAVLLRTLWVTGVIYLTALAIRWFTRPDISAFPPYVYWRQEIHDSVPWLGAILGGVYLALYARFSAQWQYLASLYNEIMAACVCTNELNEVQEANLAYWKAGFIEDAMALHLARKPMFAAAIRHMLLKNDVRNAFVTSVSGGEQMLQATIQAVNEALEADQKRKEGPRETSVPGSGNSGEERPPRLHGPHRQH